ncbi:MAG: hypothetical protein ACOCX2_11490 [Armatimonadota bacterium]
MNRYLELVMTLAIVAILTAAIVLRGYQRPSTPDSDRALKELPASPRPEPPEPSDEVRNAPVLEDVWREDFDTLDAWRLERGKPATIDDGCVTLRDAPADAPMYAQKQPLRFEAADLIIRARAPSGYLHVGVARAVAGPASELTDPPNAPKPRDGLELKLDWTPDDELSNLVRWKLDGHHWFSMPIHDAALPTEVFTTVVVRIRPDGFSVEVDGNERGRYESPRPELRWREGAYRIYLGATGGDPEVDFIELRPVANHRATPREAPA